MKEQRGIRIDDEVTSFKLLRAEHIMKRQNGVRKGVGGLLHHGKVNSQGMSHQRT